MSEMVGAFRRWRSWTSVEPGGSTTLRWCRLGIALVAVVVVAFCTLTAWQVLIELRRIRLAEYRHVLDVLTVGDVILCLLGYGLGKELLRTVGRRSV